MKRLLLLCLLLNSTFAAQAQISQLISLGLMVGVSAATKDRTQKADQYVTQVTYHGQQLSQKRTPADKLTSKGGVQIAAMEQFLAGRYAVLLADDTSPILDGNQEANFIAVQSPITANRSTWNQAPYSAEMDFYRREDTRRWQARQVLAQQQQYRQQRRDEARRDSLERVALRRIWSADSMRSAAIVRMDAQVDSIERVHAVALAAAPNPAMATRAVATRARTTSTHATVTKKKVVAVKHSTGPTVYYCASGNTVKYHASSGCRGLARCGASVDPISLREAQQSMDPCKWCY
jgi:hypothetical protein